MPADRAQHLRIVDPRSEPAPITTDLALEDGVVGNAIYQGDLVADLKAILRAEHFESEACRRTYEAALRLHDRGQPVDVVAVTHELKNTERLAQVGGAAWLAGLVQRMPVLVPRNVIEHARRIRDLHVRRRWRDFGRHAVVRAEHDGVPIAAILDDARRELEALVGELTVGEIEGRVDRVAERVVGEMLDEGERGKGSVPTGFPSLDAHVHGLPIDLAILAGLPGDGKTSLAQAIAVNVARAGGGVLFDSLETTREELLKRMAAAEARVNMARAVAGALSPSEVTMLLGGLKAVAGLPLFLEDRVDTVRELWARARAVQLALHMQGRKLRMVVVDYLQLMRGSRKFEKDHERVADVTRGLKNLAVELECAVLALSQVKESQVLERKGGRIRLEDLFGSSEIRKCGRLILGLYHADAREQSTGYQPSGIVEVDILKNNKGARGGIAELHFDGPSASFTDAGLRQDATYTCGACGARNAVGTSCACGKTETPPVWTDEDDDHSLFPEGFKP
jgi:replicative DNA helicase